MDAKAIPPLTPAIVSIALEEAALCADCERIFALGRQDCPSCGGRVWMLVARFFTATERPTTVVPLDEVLHHAGNGLTPARVLATQIAETLEELIRAPISRYKILDRICANHARRIVVAVDDTIRRLRALGTVSDAQPRKESTNA